jgi:cytochrome o ubiquinol oxidase subunit III
MSAPSTALRAGQDPYHLGHIPAAGIPEYTGHGAGGPAPKRIVVGYGFWLFILTDVILFASFFAAYAVLVSARAGGPGPRELFDLHTTEIETACLLVSSFTCGLASIAVARRSLLWTEIALAVTGLLGATFIGIEIHEFSRLVAMGAGPGRSAFLTAFFTLVGCHGVHVTCGLLWLATMMAQFRAKGFAPNIRHRYLCYSLFWHALDIVWIGIFSGVYLIGVLMQ